VLSYYACVSRCAEIHPFSMAYSRGQPNFGSGSIDSRDGYRMQNEINVAVSRQPVNIPVIAASDPWYSSATYPGFRGSLVPAERDGPGRQQANNAVLQQSVSYAAEPASAKSYRSFVSTQLGGTGQGSGSKNAYSDVTVPQNSASSYIGATSSLPNRRRSDGSAVSTQSYPIPVSSQIVYSSRAAPGGQSGLAGKVAVASSRRAEYSSGLASDATPINQPRFRQIPVVVVPSQVTRQGGERPDERSFHQTALHRDRLPQSPSVTNKNAVGSVSRSVSAAPTFSKEAEVDALTDLLVQNMNVAGNPDFCGTRTFWCYYLHNFSEVKVIRGRSWRFSPFSLCRVSCGYAGNPEVSDGREPTWISWEGIVYSLDVLMNIWSSCRQQFECSEVHNDSLMPLILMFLCVCFSGVALNVDIAAYYY